MQWLMDLIWGSGIGHAILLLAVVIATGIVLGKIKFFGVSLGITMVLFMGILLGHFGFNIDPGLSHFFREFGLILFVYSVGMQVGPGFFSSFRKGGLTLNLLAGGIVMLGVATALVIHFTTGLPIPTMVGILSGAITNTPGLGAAQQAYTDLFGRTDDTIAMGYAVAYPLGVIGIIASMLLVRYLFRIVIPQEAKAIEQFDEHSSTTSISLIVKNPAIVGKSISEVALLLQHCDFVVSRICRSSDHHIAIASGEMHLQADDIILVITQEQHKEVIQTLIGQEIAMDRKQWIPAESQFVSRRILITRPEVNGKSLGSLQLRRLHGINITRVNRAGMELVATSSFVLQIGDRLTVVGSEQAINKVSQTLGNSLKRLDEPNLMTFFLGICLGICLGSIPIAIPGIPQPVKLGLAGGPLIVAILMSRFGYRYRLITYTTLSANLLVRELGITLFLACVGLSAGDGFLDTILHQGGWNWIGYGALITLLPLCTIGFIARRFCHMNYCTLMGLIAGSMTDPPALAYANMTAGNDAPAVSYATVYPLVMFLRVLTAQLLILFFCG
ncbi:MAG: putative transporter [Parabacteroides sp.]|nr:putative transporter [Parabacteroides sp.]